MIVLCADSSPFFHPRLAQPVNRMIGAAIKSRKISSAVYFGGANGYLPEYAELAGAIAGGLGTNECLSVGSASLGRNDCNALAELQLPAVSGPALIILAGGSVTEGWKILSEATVKNWLETQLRIGAIFIGVSAGAIHLAAGLDDNGDALQYLGWVPANIAVHEESLGWPSSAILGQNNGQVLEIPMGEVVTFDPGESERPTFQSLAGKAVLNRGGKGRMPIPAGGFSQ